MTALEQAAEVRVFCCEQCGGEGGFLEECLSFGGYVRVEHFVCTPCHGEGELEVELMPVTMEDVEDMARL